jgi:glycosyltransferase involved in cell wall biosynthesis
VRPEKITLILNSADERIFENHGVRKFDRIERGARLLYHGTVAGRFGLTAAIDAVARLQEIIPETVLHIYGKYDPNYRRELEEQIERLCLSDRVVLGGYRSLEEIREIICRSDIGIVPYLSDAFMSLALSTKTFEYVAMGCPVVASRVASLQLIFDEQSIRYVAPGRPDDLAEKMAELCQHPQLRESYVKRAAQAYQAVSWPVMENRYLRLVGSYMSSAHAKT